MKTRMVGAEAFLQLANRNGVPMIEQSERSIREELTSGHVKRCELCGDVHAPIALTNIELTAYVHERNCDCCGKLQVIVRQVLKIDGHSEVRRKNTLIAKCSSECGLNVPIQTTPDTLNKVINYNTEDIANIRQIIDGHHVSYAPEITLPLCKSCHGDVHSKDEYRALQPDMKRSEWSE